MPGEESGAGRIKAADLYRMNGSLPIPNHTMQGVAGSIGSDRAGLKRGFEKLKTDGRWAEILWKSNLINLVIAVFLPVTRHIVLAELHVIEF